MLWWDLGPRSEHGKIRSRNEEVYRKWVSGAGLIDPQKEAEKEAGRQEEDTCVSEVKGP